jgi:hypothetical protein
MADVKISALPAATTPLAGTEVLPIVQSATTKKVSIADVTAGRAMSASSLTLTSPLGVASGGTGISSFGAGIATFLGTPSSANLAAAVTDETGTGALVFGTSPSITTPTFVTSATGPLFIGGTAASSSLTLQSTSGVGSSDSIVFKVGNNGATQAMTLTSGGRLGIGAASPSAALNIINSTNPQIILQTNATNSTAKEGSVGFAHYTNTEEPVFACGGFSYSGNNEVYVGGGSNALNAATTIDFYTAANSTTVTGTPRARIDSSGNLLVGTTSTIGSRRLVVQTANDAQIVVNAFDSGNGVYSTISFANQSSFKTDLFWLSTNERFFVQNGTGGVYLARNDTTWTANSDERVKDIIEPITDAVSKTLMLRAVIGKYKNDIDEKRRSFLIAQDVQQVLPEAVDANDPDLLGVSYTSVIPLLVAAIKELAAEVALLKEQLNA